MKFSLEKQENNRAYFNIEIGADKFEEAVQNVYLKNRGRFNIPGFRKGKTPRRIIEVNYGEGVFYEDAINDLLPEAYDAAIEELNLEPVSSPEVDVEHIEKDSPVIIKIEVDIKPEVKLGDYQSIELEKIEYNVTDEMIEAELKSVLDKNSRLIEIKDREVQDGDIVTIDYEGFVDEVPFEGGKAEGHQLEIGSNTFIPGFEGQIIGKNTGDEFDINVTFPEEYHSETLAGKEAIFKIKLHGIKAKELPELDDEFAKDVSEFDTLNEYKESIKSELEKNMIEQEQFETENRVLEKIVEASEVVIPESMIESQIENEIRDFEYRLNMQGLEFQKYLEITGMTIENMKEQFTPDVTRRLRTELVLEAIGKAENIEVSEDDRENELEKLANQYGKDDKEKFKDNMRKGDLNFLDTGIINNKVVELLKSKVNYI